MASLGPCGQYQVNHVLHKLLTGPDKPMCIKWQDNMGWDGAGIL